MFLTVVHTYIIIIILCIMTIVVDMIHSVGSAFFGLSLCMYVRPLEISRHGAKYIGPEIAVPWINKLLLAIGYRL